MIHTLHHLFHHPLSVVPVGYCVMYYVSCRQTCLLFVLVSSISVRKKDQSCKPHTQRSLCKSMRVLSLNIVFGCDAGRKLGLRLAQ